MRWYESDPDGQLFTSADFLPRLRLLYPEGWLAGGRVVRSWLYHRELSGNYLQVSPWGC